MSAAVFSLGAMSPASTVNATPIVVGSAGGGARAMPMHEIVRLLGGRETKPFEEPAAPLVPLRLCAGTTLALEGAPVEAVHIVRSGTFKCLRVLEDGYEQVLNFAGRGDVIGFDGLCRGAQVTSTVALEDATVYALPVRDLDRLRAQVPAFDHALQVALSRQLASATQATEMMAAVASERRLARFLVWQSDRMAARGESARRLHLRMSRRDIASLLGVAHETVSRCFTLLMRAGMLRVHNREVEIVDHLALVACARNTRGETSGARSSATPREAALAA